MAVYAGDSMWGFGCLLSLVLPFLQGVCSYVCVAGFAVGAEAIGGAVDDVVLRCGEGVVAVWAGFLGGSGMVVIIVCVVGSFSLGFMELAGAADVVVSVFDAIVFSEFLYGFGGVAVYAGFMGDLWWVVVSLVFPSFPHLLLFVLLAGFAEVMVSVFVVLVFAEVGDGFGLVAVSAGFVGDVVKALGAFVGPALSHGFVALFFAAAAFFTSSEGEVWVLLEVFDWLCFVAFLAGEFGGWGSWGCVCHLDQGC